MTIVLQRSLIMIYRQLLTIIYQNENYILLKLEHPSLYGEGCSYYLFFIVTIDIFILNRIKCENFIGFIVKVINQE